MGMNVCVHDNDYQYMCISCCEDNQLIILWFGRVKLSTCICNILTENIQSTRPYYACAANIVRFMQQRSCCGCESMLVEESGAHKVQNKMPVFF